MQRVACKSFAEASCLVANLLAELEQPCRDCGTADCVVFTGTSPTGEPVTVRMHRDLTLDVEGNRNDNNAYNINTDGTVNNNNVYNANFAPRPALMEHRVQVPRPGESRGPSSKEAISCRGKLYGGRSKPGRTHGIDADGPDTGGRPPGTSMEGGAASYQRCPALLRIQTK